MILKSPARADVDWARRRLWHPRLRSRAVSAAVLLLCGAAAVGGANYARWSKYSWTPATLLLHALGADRLALEHVNIHLTFKDKIALDLLRAEMVAADARSMKRYGVPHFALKDYKGPVPASIEHRGRRLPARARLKGSTSNHYRDGKWSLRVDLDAGSFMGMRSFALQSPERRAVLLYWLFVRLLREERVLGPRVPLVDVSINGNQKGVYTAEEIPGEGMIAAYGLPKSAIVHFSSEFIQEQDVEPRNFGEALLASRVEVQDVRELAGDPERLTLAREAAALLEGFRAGKLRARDVFDLDTLTRYLALGDVFNAWHGMGWDALRFYYDPRAKRLQPVCWDAFDENLVLYTPKYDRAFRLDSVRANPYDPIMVRLLSDPDVVKPYLARLAEFAEPSYLDRRLKDVKPDLDVYAAAVRVDYPLYQIDRELASLYEHQDFIRAALARRPGPIR